MSAIAERHRKFHAIRDELATRTYLTVQEVAADRGVSESTIRKLIEKELLPAVDMTPDSQLQTLRIRPDDVLTLDSRIRAYKRAREEGRGQEYLDQLREQWGEREARELEELTSEVA